jgi:hypothetical protein
LLLGVEMNKNPSNIKVKVKSKNIRVCRLLLICLKSLIFVQFVFSKL